MAQHGVDAEEIRDSIASKTTTVERVLASSYMSTILGLSFGKDGTLTPENGDSAAAVSLIQSLMEAMSERAFVETRVSIAAQQQAFIEEFAGMSVKKPPVQPVLVMPGGSSTTPPGTINAGASGLKISGPVVGKGKTDVAPAQAGAGGPRSKPVKLRKCLAKPGLRILNQPLNKFYSELRKLRVETNAHVSAAVIRVFIEKSSAVFLDIMNVPPLNKKSGATWHDYDVKFKDKVKAVLETIDASGANPELNYARDVANGVRDKLHTADHLNQAIHSHFSLPSHTEIVTIWDRFHPYLSALFEAIEQKPTKL